MKILECNYQEYKEKALSPSATHEDRMNFYEWFNLYGGACWNGECYLVTENCDMYLISQINEDADGDIIGIEVVDVEFRWH